MSNNLKNALTKGILLVSFLNMSLSSYTAYAQVSFAAPPVRDTNIIKTEIVPETSTEKITETSPVETTSAETEKPAETFTVSPIITELKVPIENLINPSDAVVTATPEPEIKTEEKGEETPITDAVDENQVAEKEDTATDQLFYVQLMRAVRDLKLGKAENLEKEKIILAEKLDKFIQQEKTKLEKSGVKSEKLDSYFKLLYTQIEDVKSLTPSKIEEYISKEKSDLEVKSVKKPSLFKFADEKVFIKSIKISDSNLEPATKISYLDTINPFIIATAQAAAPQFMPVIEDIQENPEVIISSDIKTLADELHRNPVEILNYVYANIDYEPYYGAKKGSDGCLKELVCNDTDAASLTIALMRASGIPARYRKGVAVMPVQQIKELLGVDEVKTVYFALAANKVPVYVLSGNNVGTNVDAYDFSQETHLAVEWTYPEIFYDYDERGANFPNTVDLSAVQTTQELRDLFADTHKKQWIPADGITKTYTRAQNQIVHDTVAFNTQNFWNGFLQYQGALSPFDKYKQDLQTQTGKDLTNPLYQTIKTKQARTFNILPSTRPYVFAQGVDSNGNTINIETWSQLPDVRRFKVSVTLLKASDNSVVLNQNFYSSEINNVPFDVMYEGATTTDQQTIDSYGGIHMTPASLVNIKPYFLSDYGKYETTTTTTIGEPLILQFEYFVNGNSIYTDQKNSVAGNMEGIYIILSKLQDDPTLTDGYDDNSQILLEGNAKLAWKYIREVQVKTSLLEKAFDYELNTNLFRAVVTQNRILSEVGGIPTTFDFQGLTIDASTYILDYSSRGNYKSHKKDIWLIWGEQASYYEAQIFKDVTGIDSISTVKGLQYAYANPGTYTIHTITTTNESVIDTLNLSANTKQNMHTAVQAGKTVITPDNMVTMGTFTGVLYIAIDSNGTGNYTIGEQNGGEMVQPLNFSSYIDLGQQILYETWEAYNNTFYLYEDKIGYSVSCNISDQAKAATLNEQGYIESYGKPCYVPSVPGGQTYPYEYYQVNQSFKIATNATKFWRSSTNPSRPSYSYWHYNSEIIQKLDDYAASNNLNSFQGVEFSPAIGSYIKIINEYEKNLYYSPSYSGNDKGNIYLVEIPILSRYIGYSYDTQQYWCSQNNPGCGNNLVINYLGLPVSNKQNSSNSEWKYQDFIGGRIYVHNWFGGFDTFYVPSQINEYYKNNGDAGKYGYPTNRPIWDSGTQILFVDYQKGRINLINQVTSDGQIIKTITSQWVVDNDKVYWEGFYDQLAEEGIVGFVINISSGIAISEAFIKLFEVLSKRPGFIAKAGVKLVPLIGIALLAYSIIMTEQEISLLNNACNSNIPVNGINERQYFCGKRDAVIVLVALGILADNVARNMAARNVFYTGGATQVDDTIRSSKFRVYNLMNTSNYNYVAQILESNPLLRKKFFDMTNRLTDDADITPLLNNKNYTEGLFGNGNTKHSLDTWNGYIKSGLYQGHAKYRVDPKYSYEFSLYTQADKFDTVAMRQAGLLKSSAQGTFYTLSDLDTAIQIFHNQGLINKGGEIIFVLKQDGTMKFAPRRDTPIRDNMPHPYLAAGEDVISAGVIIPEQATGKLFLYSKTGHYKINPDDLAPVEQILESRGYIVDNQGNNFN